MNTLLKKIFYKGHLLQQVINHNPYLFKGTNFFYKDSSKGRYINKKVWMITDPNCPNDVYYSTSLIKAKRFITKANSQVSC